MGWPLRNGRRRAPDLRVERGRGLWRGDVREGTDHRVSRRRPAPPVAPGRGPCPVGFGRACLRLRPGRGSARRSVDRASASSAAAPGSAPVADAAAEPRAQIGRASARDVAGAARPRLLHGAARGAAAPAPLRTNLADILIERDGPALRPGTRSYARSWIRDGAMMSAALLRMGHPEAVRSYADWFAVPGPGGPRPVLRGPAGRRRRSRERQPRRADLCDRGVLAVHEGSRVPRLHVPARRERGLVDRPGAAAAPHGGIPRSREAPVLRPAARSRSATRGTRRSPSIPTGTTSGRSRA